MKISATIITLDEEKRIGDCLASLDFVDEIVVVDSGSTDRTGDICRAHPKVRFAYHPWEGYGRQKNTAVAMATGDWIFSVDADEIVTPELADQVRTSAREGRYDGYFVRRKNYYRGQWIRHCGWWPDEILRLFRRDKGRFNDRVVHESVEVSGNVGRLEGCIEHHSFATAGDFLTKAQAYSSLGAEQLYASGKGSSVGKAISRSLFSFFKTYFLQLGMLDGRAGVLISYSNAVGVFYRYMKLLEMEARHNGSA